MPLVVRLVLWCSVLLCGVPLFASGRSSTKSVNEDVNRLYDAKTQNDAANRLLAAGPRVIPLVLPVICDKTKSRFDVAWPIAAKVLGEMKAEAASRCLVSLLMYDYPPLGPVVMKSDKTLIEVDPAFAALVRIGEPAVPAIRSHLPFLGPEQALMALRVLRIINTPSAKEAAEAYLKLLQDQIRLAGDILLDFGTKPGGMSFNHGD
jgi:hypothetical protein